MQMQYKLLKRMGAHDLKISKFVQDQEGAQKAHVSAIKIQPNKKCEDYQPRWLQQM